MDCKELKEIFSLIKGGSGIQSLVKERVTLVTKSEFGELRGDLPEEYYSLICCIEYMEVWGAGGLIHFLSLEDAEWMNVDSDCINALPFLFFFADDNGACVYAFDPQNKWGKGTNAIFKVSRGCCDKETSQFLGKNLLEVLGKLKGRN